MKKNICAGQPNTAFVWSSFQAKNFTTLPSSIPPHTVVVITNAYQPTITLYDVDGLTPKEIKEMVRDHCALLSAGCTYKYKIIKQVGCCFFVN